MGNMRKTKKVFVATLGTRYRANGFTSCSEETEGLGEEVWEVWMKALGLSLVLGSARRIQRMEVVKDWRNEGGWRLG